MARLSELGNLKKTLRTLPQLHIDILLAIIDYLGLCSPDDHRVLSVKRWIPVKRCSIPECGTSASDPHSYAPEVIGLEGREADLIKVLGYEDNFYPGSSQDFWRWFIPKVTWRTEVEIIEQDDLRSWTWSLEDFHRLESAFGVDLRKIDAVVGHISHEADDPIFGLDPNWQDLNAALEMTDAVLKHFGGTSDR